MARNRPQRRRPGGRPGQTVSLPDLLTQAATLLQGGAARQALRLYRKVLAAEPGHPDALNLGGVAAFQAGNTRRGLEWLRRAVEVAPFNVNACNNLGNVLRADGQSDEAETAYRQALSVDSGYADAHYNLAILLEQLGRMGEAEAHYRHVIELMPGFAQADFSLANVLRTQGKLDQAEAAYRRTLAAEPDHAAALNNLGTVYQERGRFEEAANLYGRAAHADPGFAEAPYNLGAALQEAERHEESLAAYAQALAIDPGHPGAQINRACALQALGHLDEAVAAFGTAIDLAADFPKVHANLADAHLQREDPESALAVCEAFLDAHPGDTAVLAFKAVVLGDLGRRDAAGALVDFDRFIRPQHLEAPDGYADMAAFNRALAEHVLDHPTLVYAPSSHATRKGRHSGELLSQPKGPVAALETAIEKAIADYRRDMGVDPNHPFLADPPPIARLSVWGVAMESQGHQVAHIHPEAWLSGVYYVRLPDAVGGGGNGEEGWIEFGRPPEHFHNAAEPEVKSYRPEEGLMVLFPSYFYHRTIPFESDQLRISIAFDARPDE